MEEIVFTLEYGSEWIPEKYYPVPGVKAVPDWYKNMATSHAENKSDAKQVDESQTIKRCMPVLDAMTTGYVIKTHTDIYVKDVDGVISYEWASDTKDTIVFHPAFQVQGYKNLDLPLGAPKIRNPWAVKTPKGYSCLFISPPHRPVSGITILEGIVDTDGYTAPVQFPFMLDKDFTGLIPAGTPIAQVIPFKRTSFRMKIGDNNERKKNDLVARLLNSVWINGYRNNWRASKDYL